MDQNPVMNTSSPRRSIRTRLLLLAAGAMVVALVILLAAALFATTSVINTAERSSADSLRTQAQEYLQQVNRGIAEQNTLLLDRAARDVRTVVDAAIMIFNEDVPLAEPKYTLIRGVEGQYINGPDELTSVVIPNTTMEASLMNSALSLKVLNDVEKTALLEMTLQVVKENNPDAGALYIGTQTGLTRYYPNIELGKLVPADFNATKRPWYIAALEKNTGAVETDVVYSEVYYDAAGLGLITTVSMPVRAGLKPPVQNTGAPTGDFVGVVGLDLALSQIQRNIQASSSATSGYTFLIDSQGKVIIMPDQGWLDLLGRTFDEQDPTPDLSAGTSSPELKAVIDQMIRGNTGFDSLEINGREYFIAYAPFRSTTTVTVDTGWSLASLVPSEEMLGSVAALQTELNQTTRQVLLTRVLPVGLGIGALLLLLAWIGTNRLVSPFVRLADAAQMLGAGKWDEPTPILNDIEARNQDEIGLLAHTLNAMSGQLRQSFGRLEQRVAERTQELERRSLQLQTASEIGREITLARDLDTMLMNAVDLISDRFGYYNVGIFLVDETSEYVHLKAASGELGHRLLEQDIRLKVGVQGIVGYVTRFGQTRLASDVRTDRTYQEHSLLADTRSEVALPLRSGPKVIGALDVQSTKPLAFSEDDVIVLQTLADQLAIAIDNVRLVSQMQAAIQEAGLLYQQQTRSAWDRQADQMGAAGYEYDLLEVKPVRAGLKPALTTPTGAASSTGAARSTGAIYQAPVKLRDQVIGVIGMESQDPDHVWTEDEIAIIEATANQAAISVENARLLAESQRRASQEQLAAEVTAKMRASLDMENVLQTAMQELAQRLNIAQVNVHLNPAISTEAAPSTASAPVTAAALSTAPVLSTGPDPKPRRNGDEAV